MVLIESFVNRYLKEIKSARENSAKKVLIDGVNFAIESARINAISD